jgi:hypothetical protein
MIKKKISFSVILLIFLFQIVSPLSSKSQYFAPLMVEAAFRDDATIKIAADDEYEMWIDYSLIKKSSRPVYGKNWLQAGVIELKGFRDGLRDGDYVHVKARNLGGPKGLIAEIVFKNKIEVTDSSWEVLSKNGRWVPATMYGNYGVAPWGQNVSGFTNTNAKWIWSNGNDNEVHFRFKINMSKYLSDTRFLNTPVYLKHTTSGNYVDVSNHSMRHVNAFSKNKHSGAEFNIEVDGRFTYIKSLYAGTYWCGDLDSRYGNVYATRNWRRDWERFDFIRYNNSNSYIIKHVYTGKYVHVGANPKSGGNLKYNETDITKAARFTIHRKYK